MEYLYFAGDDRFGALGVSTSEREYRPRRFGPLPKLGDAERLSVLVQKVLNNEPISAAERRLISPGGTMGGARPKALLDIDGEQWVVKFSAGEPVDNPLIEHASMTLAQHAGIDAAQTMPIKLLDGHAVAIKRFDRIAGQRLHAISANVALKAALEQIGYPELAQLLRRRGVTDGDTNLAQMHELFRRMVFNILLDNTDDHEKNHALVMTESQMFRLSPAFDVLPSGQALGYQQMRVGTQGADSTLENAVSMATMFAMSSDAARKTARDVARVVNRWRRHFRQCGVSKNDIELLAEQIDRPFLKEQRED